MLEIGAPGKRGCVTGPPSVGGRTSGKRVSDTAGQGSEPPSVAGMTWSPSRTRGVGHGIAELAVAAEGGQRGRSACTALGNTWSRRERGKVKSSGIENKDFAEIVKLKGLSFWGEDEHG